MLKYSVILFGFFAAGMLSGGLLMWMWMVTG